MSRATDDAPPSSENKKAPDDRQATRQSTTPPPCRAATINPKHSPCQRQSHRTSSRRRGHKSSPRLPRPLIQIVALQLEAVGICRLVVRHVSSVLALLGVELLLERIDAGA